MKDLSNIFTYFPSRIQRELFRVFSLNKMDKLIEIHIVLGSGSSVRFLCGRIFLGVTVSEADIEETVLKFTGRALYAHRHTIKDGYITVGGGIRVGICGQARYERGELVGVSEVTSILVRIPTLECHFKDKLLSAFEKTERGMLIFAPPCGGKTTALRALIKRISLCERAPRISVIDERCEFSSEDFIGTDVDIFRGYSKGEGMRIALRVMSPEIIAVDEIGGACEGGQVAESLLSGVKFIATAHGECLSDIKKRKSLSEFFSLDAFDTFVKITENGGVFDCEIIREDLGER